MRADAGPCSAASGPGSHRAPLRSMPTGPAQTSAGARHGSRRGRPNGTGVPRCRMGLINAAVFLDLRRCAARSRATLEDFYRSLIARSPLLHGCLDRGDREPGKGLRGDQFHRRPFVRRRFSSDSATPPSPSTRSRRRACRPPCSPPYRRPLSSTRRCGGPTIRAPRWSFTAPDTSSAPSSSRGLAAQFYAVRAGRTAEQFWQERAAGAVPAKPESRRGPPSVGTRLRLAGQAKLARHPVLRGDFITLEETLVHPTSRRSVRVRERCPPRAPAQAVRRRPERRRGSSRLGWPTGPGHGRGAAELAVGGRRHRARRRRGLTERTGRA